MVINGAANMFRLGIEVRLPTVATKLNETDKRDRTVRTFHRITQDKYKIFHHRILLFNRNPFHEKRCSLMKKLLKK